MVGFIFPRVRWFRFDPNTHWRRKWRRSRAGSYRRWRGRSGGGRWVSWWESFLVFSFQFSGKRLGRRESRGRWSLVIQVSASDRAVPRGQLTCTPEGIDRLTRECKIKVHELPVHDWCGFGAKNPYPIDSDCGIPAASGRGGQAAPREWDRCGASSAPCLLLRWKESGKSSLSCKSCDEIIRFSLCGLND
jgi:hypothetical protein